METSAPTGIDSSTTEAISGIVPQADIDAAAQADLEQENDGQEAEEVNVPDTNRTVTGKVLQFAGGEGAAIGAEPTGSADQKASSGNPYDDVIRGINEELGYSDSPEESSAQADLPEGIDPESPAGKAYQAAFAKAQQAESATQNLQQQYQQQMQQMQQQVQQQFQPLQQQLHQLQTQNAVLQAKLEMGMQQRQQEPMDPVDELKSKWLEEAKQSFNPEIEKLRAENKAMQDGFAERERTARRETYKNQFLSEASQYTKEMVLKGFRPEQMAQYETPISSLVLGLAAQTGTKIPEAAQMVRHLMLSFSRDFLLSNSKQTRAPIAKARATTPPTVTGSSRGSGGGEATDEDIEADGRFRDRLEWSLKGKPALRRQQAR